MGTLYADLNRSQATPRAKVGKNALKFRERTGKWRQPGELCQGNPNKNIKLVFQLKVICEQGDFFGIQGWVFMLDRYMLRGAGITREARCRPNARSARSVPRSTPRSGCGAGRRWQPARPGPVGRRRAPTGRS